MVTCSKFSSRPVRPYCSSQIAMAAGHTDAPMHRRLMLTAIAILAATMFLIPAQGQAARMSFTLMTASGIEGCANACRIVVAAEGQIDNTSASRLERLVRENFPGRHKGLTVLLKSTGGYVIAAAKLGKVFRKYRATVVVAVVGSVNTQNLRIRLRPATCTSACVYALMGGYKRVLPGGSKLVLHRSYSDGALPGQREYSNDILRQFILGYARSMGVSQKAIEFAERLHPSRLYPVNERQLKAWNLARAWF